MMVFKISYRNILRNRRRSAMTVLAVAAGTMAMLLFGGFQAYVFAGLETGAVERVGHLTAFREGYFLYGAGNPVAYGIDGYRDVIALIQRDPELQPLLNVVTPTLQLMGIAGSFSGASSASKTFLGTGFVPSDRARLRLWDEHGVRRAADTGARLDDRDAQVGFVGVGLGRILGLCGPLKIAECPPAPAPPALDREPPPSPAEDFSALEQQDAAREPDPHAGLPRLDLLAATANGAPNVVNLYVQSAEAQGVKELDENTIGMHLTLAQQLVYGRSTPRVTGIVVQLHRTEDLTRARKRLAALFKEHQLPLEVRDFADLNPFYSQTRSFFGSIFLFIAAIMGMIVLFTVVNTMTMAVLERTTEVGTVRALGIRHLGIRRQFLVEGSMLGAIGATLGVVLAGAVSLLVNRAGLMWTPPGNVSAVPFRLELFHRGALMAMTWVGLTVVATLAAWVPARRAARLQIVDALRHV